MATEQRERTSLEEEIARLNNPIEVYNFFNSRVRLTSNKDELREINGLMFSIANASRDLQPLMVHAYMRKYTMGLKVRGNESYREAQDLKLKLANKLASLE